MTHSGRHFVVALTLLSVALPATAAPPRQPSFDANSKCRHTGVDAYSSPAWRWVPADGGPATTKYRVWPSWMKSGAPPPITGTYWEAKDAPPGDWQFGVAASNDQGELSPPLVESFRVLPALSPSALTACVQFYSVNSTSIIGVRNVCNECKIAVIAYATGGSGTIKEVQLQGKGSTQIGNGTMRIIDSKSCPGTPAPPATNNVRCFSFYPTGGAALGLRNTCEQCSIAVIDFIGDRGGCNLKEFRVPGKSSATVSTGVGRIEIRGQKPCQ